MFSNGQNDYVSRTVLDGLRCDCGFVHHGRCPPDFSLSKVNVEEANIYYDIYKAEAKRRGATTTITVPIIERRFKLRPKTLTNYRANHFSRHGLPNYRKLGHKRRVLRKGLSKSTKGGEKYNGSKTKSKTKAKTVRPAAKAKGGLR